MPRFFKPRPYYGIRDKAAYTRRLRRTTRIGVNRNYDFPGLIARRQMAISGPEMKYKDTSLVGVNTALTAGVIVGIDQIGQGLTNITRVGNKVNGKYLKGTFVFNVVLSAVGRLIIFQDINNTTSTTAGVTDVLSTANFFSNTNPVNRDRFRILKDVSFNLSSGGPATKVVDFYFSKLGVQQYDNTTAASFREGHYFYLIIADGANQITYQMMSRYTFYDI